MDTYRVQVFKSILVRDSNAKIRVPHIGAQMRMSAHCAEVFHTYLKHADVEHFVALWLDQKNRIVGLRTVSTGSLSATVVHPREVFLGTSEGRVASLVLGHNHPSGDTAPSRNDIALTASLVRVGEILSIPVLDHIIIGYDDCGEATPYYSFADNDLIKS